MTAGRTAARAGSPLVAPRDANRNAKNARSANIAWKLDSGCPPKNWSATSAARPAAGSGPGRRISSSAITSSHGTSAKMLESGHASQTMKNVPKA